MQAQYPVPERDAAFHAARNKKIAATAAMAPRYRRALEALVGTVLGPHPSWEQNEWKKFLHNLGVYMDGRGEHEDTTIMDKIAELPLAATQEQYEELIRKFRWNGLHVLEENLRQSLKAIQTAAAVSGGGS